MQSAHRDGFKPQHSILWSWTGYPQLTCKWKIEESSLRSGHLDVCWKEGMWYEVSLTGKHLPFDLEVIGVGFTVSFSVFLCGESLSCVLSLSLSSSCFSLPHHVCSTQPPGRMVPVDPTRILCGPGIFPKASIWDTNSQDTAKLKSSLHSDSKTLKSSLITLACRSSKSRGVHSGKACRLGSCSWSYQQLQRSLRAEFNHLLLSEPQKMRIYIYKLKH